MADAATGFFSKAAQAVRFVVGRLWHNLSRTFVAAPAVPILVSIAFSVALARIGQFKELYLSYLIALRQPEHGEINLHIAFALIALLLFSALILVSNRALACDEFQEVFSHRIADPTRDKWVQTVGWFAAVLPWLGLLSGIATALGTADKHLKSVLETTANNFDNFNVFPVDMAKLDALDKALAPWHAVLAGLPGFGAIVVLWIALCALWLLRSEISTFIRAKLFRSLRPKAPARIVRRRPRLDTFGDAMQRFQLIHAPSALGTLTSLIVLVIVVLISAVIFAPPGIALAKSPTLQAGGKNFWEALHAALAQVPTFSRLLATPISTWLLSSLALTLLAFMVMRLRSRISRRGNGGLSRGLMLLMAANVVIVWALVVVSLLSGLIEFEWVKVSRAVGPLAWVILLATVVLGLLVGLTAMARDMGLPVLLIIAGATLVVVSWKVGAGPSAQLCGLVLSGMAIALPLIAVWRRQPIPRSEFVLVFAAALAFANVFEERTNQARSGAHGAHGIATNATTAKLQLDVRESFAQWLKTRKDVRAAFRERNGGKQRYPVFIIAAEGGGIYAAATVSAFLARMQERCPSFAQHVFAISGVSGGAVGSLVFHGAVDTHVGGFQEERCADPATLAELTRATLDGAAGAKSEPLSLQQRVANVIKDDHLSQLVGLAAADFLGTFHDRAEGLEESLQWSMREHFCPHGRREYCAAPWQSGYASHWSPTDKRVAPALVMNTTLVSDGYRTVYAPFSFDEQEFAALRTFNQLSARYCWEDAKTTTTKAAVTSARFPGVLKSFSVVESASPGKDCRSATSTTSPSDGETSKRVWSFVDGGYVDSSGALTAEDIYEALTARNTDYREQKLDVDLRLILLTSTPTSTDHADSHAKLRDVASPIVTLFSVRAFLSAIAVRETVKHHDFAGSADQDSSVDRLRRLDHASQWGYPEGWRVTTIELDQDDYKFELGWKISPLTYDIISLHLGQAELCRRANKLALVRRDLETKPGSTAAETKTASTTEAETMRNAPASVIRANSCVMAAIEALLDPGQRGGWGISPMPYGGSPAMH